MATVILSTVGAAVGGMFGGAGAALGRAAGGLLGNAIDRAVLGGDERAIEGPRLEEVAITSVGEGTAIPRAYGTVRTAGHLIWATRFEEAANVEREGGKGGGAPATEVTTYSYSGNAAYALCEGPITAVRRVWADGVEIDLMGIEMRVHRGTQDQLPDPLIEAKQGGDAPAFRGTAYAVFERLPLERYGNRLPQMSFEVIRAVNSLAPRVRAITVIPGSTEHGYDPEPAGATIRAGESALRNRHVLHARSDWSASIDELTALCPNLETVSLVVAWFGDSLDAAQCRIAPRVENRELGLALPTPWHVGDATRATARLVSRVDGRPAYGGTPDDASVVRAIADLKARGLKVYLYPFVLMDVPAGNGLADPYGGPEQPAHPWRGRITCSPAPGRAGTPDRTAAAQAVVDAFMGTASRPNYAAFIDHYARLCASAGGVDGFLIGSEMRGLTQLRSDGGFPFVQALRGVARRAKATLGTATRVLYAADWSEYFGLHPDDGSGDVYFHLDPLWADPAIDAVGIDNYLPLSDWRDEDRGGGSPDAMRSPYDRPALRAAITGGERFDWYYASDGDRAARRRTPIADGAHAKPWVFRPKDIEAWWANPHHERRGGLELATPTAWRPRMKPIVYTELGAPAVDRAANGPNVFPDPKSSEDALPPHSTGARDDLAQHSFVSAHLDRVEDPDAGAAVAPDDVFLWTWDARPMPAFPTREDVWSDGPNWAVGHWLDGRLSGASLADLIAAVLRDHAIEGFDASGVEGWAAGLLLSDPSSARRAVEPIVETHGIGVREADGTIVFEATGPAGRLHALPDLAAPPGEPEIVRRRAASEPVPGEAVLAHRDPMRDHAVRTVRARAPGTSRSEAAVGTRLTLERADATALAHGFLQRLRGERDTVEVDLPWSAIGLRIGDHVTHPLLGPRALRLEAIEDGLTRRATLRLPHEPMEVLLAPADDPAPAPPTVWSGRPLALALDLPLVPGRDTGAAIAGWMRPWAPLAVLRHRAGELDRAGTITEPCAIATLTDALAPGPVAVPDRANRLRVMLPGRSFEAVSRLALLGGANALAIQCARGWEVLQFEVAEEFAPGMWELSGLLRARLGTEHAMVSGAAKGAFAVLLDAAPLWLAGADPERGASEWRVGRDGAPLDARGFATLTADLGVEALRPLAPVHLRGRLDPAGDLRLSWVRRGRVDADGWLPEDIALGEEREAYAVRLDGPRGAREWRASAPALMIPAAELIAAGLRGGPAALSIQQIGTRVGAGHAATATIDLA